MFVLRYSQDAMNELPRHWWVLALRGAAALIFGILVLLLPGAALLILVYLFAAYALVDGIFALVGALRFAGGNLRGELALILEGIVGIIIAGITYLAPAITAIAFAYIVSAWAIVTGVLAVVSALRARVHVPGDWLWLLSGIVSIVLGVAIAVFPLAGVLAYTYMIGFYAIIAGIALLGVAFRLRGVHERTGIAHP